MNLECQVSDITGEMAKRLTLHLEQVQTAIGQRVAEGIRHRLSQSQAAGHLYGKRQVSAPGQAPDDPYGALANSIVVSEGGHVVEVTVGSAVAAYLELGTSRMAPRPFVLPAAQAAFQQAESDLSLNT